MVVATGGVASCTADRDAGPATSTSEPKIVMPDGVLGAQPLLHRGDPAKGQLHVKLVNRSGERLDIDALQLVWEGFTSPLTERRIVLVGSQRVDIPLPFPGATCVGDGSAATMPHVGAATVRLVLNDGTERSVPVYDVDGVARSLYLKDCERQMIERLVGIEWVDVEAATLDGRPVTEGWLQLTRRARSGAISVHSVSNTVVFVVEPVDVAAGAPLVTLDAGEQEASVRVRFVENRCDPHAIAEASQPFDFVVQLQIDGAPHPYLALPPAADQPPMRQRLDAGCQALGRVEPVG